MDFFRGHAAAFDVRVENSTFLALLRAISALLAAASSDIPAQIRPTSQSLPTFSRPLPPRHRYSRALYPVKHSSGHTLAREVWMQTHAPRTLPLTEHALHAAARGLSPRVVHSGAELGRAALRRENFGFPGLW